MVYDRNNIFARILRAEIPCKKLYENEFVLAFHDINPLKKNHILVIPKGEYVSFDDFTTRAPAQIQVEFYAAVQKVAADSGMDTTGYRLISNHGADGGQEVPHYHVHILGGEKVGKMTA
jgi:diadenosine tetraphosphate (Ap4A) HIT family hydrolase